LLDSLGENSRSEYAKDEKGDCQPFHDATRTATSVCARGS
jgi:hypothetical protein